MKFEEMNLLPSLMVAIEESGYITPTPIQESTVPTALAGRDILGCAKTGTGKTAAFALPILQRLAAGTRGGVRALILAPTRELAIQNEETFAALGRHLSLSVTAVFGGVNQAGQVNALRAGADILVATPGRLLDLIRQNLISLDRVSVFVLDEADRMLDMGFIHDVRRVVALLPKERQTMLFSATMPTEVESLAMGLLRNPATVRVDPGHPTVDKIKQTVYFVQKEHKRDLLLHLLLEGGISTALVFTRTKSNADQVARILTKNRIKSAAIHGNKSQNARQRALSDFRSGAIDVLVATDIAARGIDISELPFVINYNIPDEPETYIHRIGRTGRAGMDGVAVSICESDELLNWRAVEKTIRVPVRVGACEWSVTDMVPTERPRRAPLPPRSERQKNDPRQKTAHTPEPQNAAKPKAPKPNPEKTGLPPVPTGGRRRRRR